MRVKRTEEESFEIMLIPMIDCMLVIIIFFLVATTLKHKERQLQLQLPQSAAALQVEQTPNLFIVAVDKQGGVYLSAGEQMERVDYDRLHVRLRETARSNPHQTVRIDADRDARFEDVVHLIDLCQFEGIHNVRLHTKSDGQK